MCVAKKYAYKALDVEFKSPSGPDIESILEPKEWFVEPISKEEATDPYVPEPSAPAILKEMMAQNPAIEKLVGSMGLGIKDDTLPF